MMYYDGINCRVSGGRSVSSRRIRLCIISGRGTETFDRVEKSSTVFSLEVSQTLNPSNKTGFGIHTKTQKR